MKKQIKYKGINIIRQGNILYLGNFSDQYIIMIQVLESKIINELYISNKISVQLHDNNNKQKPIIRKTEKYNLFDAIDIGHIWLSRMNCK